MWNFNYFFSPCLCVVIFVLLNSVLVIGNTGSTNEFYRQTIFHAIGQGGFLKSNVISNVVVEGWLECGQHCLSLTECLSFNYRSTYNDRKVNCQLINKRIEYLLPTPVKNTEKVWTLYNSMSKAWPLHLCVNHCKNDGKSIADLHNPERFLCQCGKHYENYLKDDYDVKFSGNTSNDYVKIPIKQASFDSFTLSTWFKMKPSSQNYHLLSYMANGTIGFEISFLTRHNAQPLSKTIWRFKTIILGKYYGTNVIPVNDDYWHHLGFIWSSDGRWLLVIDGVLWGVRLSFQVGKKISGNGTLLVGQSQTTLLKNKAVPALVGEISLLNIWNKALSKTELEQMARSPGNEKGNFLSWTNFVEYLDKDTGIITPSSVKNTVLGTNYKLIFDSQTGHDYVTLFGPSESLNTMSSCVWIKTSRLDSWFFSYIIGENQVVLAYGYDTGKYYNLHVNGVLARSTIPSLKLNNSNWHFICFAWSGDAGTVNFYHDGILHGITLFGSFSTIPPGGNFTIGFKGNVSNGLLNGIKAFTGVMSQLNIWHSFLYSKTIRVMSAGQANVNGNLVSWRNVGKGIVRKVTVNTNLTLFLPGWTLLSKRTKWCNDHINASCSRLFARIGRGVDEDGMFWHCSCGDVLVPTKYTLYFKGNSSFDGFYFTKHQELSSILSDGST